MWKKEKRHNDLKQIGILLFVFLSSFFLLHIMGERSSSSRLDEGETYLSKLESRDLNKIKEQLKHFEKSRLLKGAHTKEERMKIRFGNAVILGDSIVEGLYAYQLLDANQAIYKRGRRINNCDEEINKAVQLSPEALFLNYGMNDLIYFRGDAQLFIAAYEETVNHIRRKLPHTSIYVNSILPIDAHAIASTPSFAYVDAFNQALQTYCEKENLMFIDNTKLLKNSADYESAGVHPKSSFYPLWLEHMLKEVGW